MKKNLAEWRMSNDKKMLKHLSDAEKKLNKMQKKLKQTKPAVMKRVAKKSIARRLVGKHLAKEIPGVGVAIIARDVVKGISKATCSKRGGKWVSGKCKGVKKDTRKITSPQVRDPISKR